jgi:hypothetical protein
LLKFCGLNGGCSSYFVDHFYTVHVSELGFFGLLVVKGDSVVLGWPNLDKICQFFFLDWMENFAPKKRAAGVCLWVEGIFVCFHPCKAFVILI